MQYIFSHRDLRIVRRQLVRYARDEPVRWGFIADNTDDAILQNATVRFYINNYPGPRTQNI
jgi:hypothetical protein